MSKTDTLVVASFRFLDSHLKTLRMLALLEVLRDLFSVDVFCGRVSFKLFMSLFGGNDDEKEVEEACKLLFEEALEDVDLLMTLINKILSTGALFLDHDLDPEVGYELL